MAVFGSSRGLNTLRNYVISVVGVVGQKVFSLNYQSFLLNKKIIGIFVSGETQDQNGNTLTNSGFYLNLFAGTTQIMSMPAATDLNFNQENIVYINRNDIDFDKTNITFPTVISGSNKYIDIVVWYEDESGV